MKICSFLTLFSALLIPALGHAQGYSSYQNQALLDDAKIDIYTVAGSGMVGAIMGLSTLSFAENPSQRLKNIVTGGALGIVVGVAIVASSQANKSQNLFAVSAHYPPPLFESYPKNDPWKGANWITFNFSF